VKAALAIGGTSALAACAERERRPDADGTPANFTTASTDSSSDQSLNAIEELPDLRASLPDRQHAWGDYIVKSQVDNPKFPQYQAFLFLDYTGSTPPTERERRHVEAGFRTLEHAFPWGTEAQQNPTTNQGLLFTMGYADAYFERFDSSLPDSVGLQPPEAVLEQTNDDPSKADDYDAVLHLGSDVGTQVQVAEEALLGNVDSIEETTVVGGLTGSFELAERRTGVVGNGLPAERIENDDIPESSPVSMGFQSAYKDTFPPEEKATIQEGPFAGSTIQQVSRLENDLQQWYDQSVDDRVEKMYSPHHTHDQVGDTGRRLGNDSEMTESIAAQTQTDATQQGRVGHGQKLARVRDDDFDPLVLRRGDFVSGLHGDSVLHFGGIQRTTEDFIRTRQAMDRLDLDAESEAKPISEADDGILESIEVTNRATFLMPTRARRALPTPNPEESA